MGNQWVAPLLNPFNLLEPNKEQWIYSAYEPVHADNILRIKISYVSEPRSIKLIWFSWDSSMGNLIWISCGSTGSNSYISASPVARVNHICADSASSYYVPSSTNHLCKSRLVAKSKSITTMFIGTRPYPLVHVHIHWYTSISIGTRPYPFLYFRCQHSLCGVVSNILDVQLSYMMGINWHLWQWLTQPCCQSTEPDTLNLETILHSVMWR